MSYTLITGASTGLGKDFAIHYAQKSHPLILVSRNKERLGALAAELRESYKIDVEVFVCDLSQKDAGSELFNQVNAKKLEVSRLINNAGIGFNGGFLDLSLEDQKAMMQLNMDTLVDLCHLFATPMRASGLGEILNIASTAAYQAGPFMAVYFASKAFVVSFSEALHSEFKGDGVVVTALSPGATKTEFFSAERHMKTPLNAMDSATVVKIGARALASKKSSVIPGMMNKFMVFGIRFAPRAMVISLSKLIILKLIGR